MERRWCDPVGAPAVRFSSACGRPPTKRPPADVEGDAAILRATRALLRATTRAQAREVLYGVLADLAVDSRSPEVTAGRILRHLPGLIEDAAFVADRAEEALRHHADASVDPLTGVATQGVIATRLEAAPQGAVICVLDLDGFKNINDRLGHLAGDATLRRFGGHVRAALRSSDFVARAGGDEFLVILDEGAGMFAARRRMSALASSWAAAERQASTVSIGVAEVTGAGPILAAVAADQAMYRAKRDALTVEVARAGDGILSSDAVASDTYDAYLASLAVADPAQAVAALARGAQRGMSERELISGVIGRAQVAVGAGWAAGDWGVAQEHAATLVAERALAVVAPPASVSASATRIVMACAEGETHTMAIQMAAQLARDDDLEVVVLGAGMPADELAASLRRLRPSVLGLSTTVATNLIGARRSIQAARAEGIPVLVGGAAWGTTQDRARRLGAHAMLLDVGDLARFALADTFPLDAGPVGPLDEEAILLENPPPALVEAALVVWVARQEREPTSRERGKARGALEWVARHAAAAAACDDRSIVGELLERQVSAARTRGLASQPTLDLYTALAQCLLPVAPVSAAVLLGAASP